MPEDTLEQVRLLSNLESNRHKLLQIVLFGQPELDETLAKAELAPAARPHHALLPHAPARAGRGGEVPVVPHARRRLSRARGVHAARRAPHRARLRAASRGASTSSPTSRCSPPSPRTRTRSPTGTCAPRSPTRNSRRSAGPARPLLYLGGRGRGRRRHRRRRAVDAVAAGAGARRMRAEPPRRGRRLPAGPPVASRCRRPDTRTAQARAARRG